MKISGISLYALELPLETPQVLSRGRVFDKFHSTFIRIDTDAGISGWGEVCPWGSSYLPAFPGGVRAALMEMAPQLIGCDPTRPDVLVRYMDRILAGHIYAKAAVDFALYDIIGKATGQPIYELLGGKEENAVPRMASIHLHSLDETKAEIEQKRIAGYKNYSIKVGQGFESDVATIKAVMEQRKDGEFFIFDSNGGWSPHEATRLMNAVSHLDTTFEQPCLTYEECLDVRTRTRQPISLDECMVELKDFVRALSDRGCELVSIKLARVGGLTKARAIRDLCLAYDINLFMMCMAGTVINDTVAAHFAQTIPANRFYGAWSCQDYITVDPAPQRGARTINGHMPPPNLPGLGVEPDMEVLGAPIAVFK
ncbi:mandelate racemase/muconate lactonizing enzyme family protein [Sinorhizobium mexicanum]|uniref:Mandelate racemase/muconate lactonizing protein n=1 Tax=Sinorhizobium mexicanum TaxID=375549 RepID=A0A859QMQ2_9HYPH|nr:mandelate racemase/muconate lactonizing enzyme family protein [Sinorhizobium mexicanum]MBP1881791.1 L-alanine-DL-glutamate epimerase-like enolase superfamily enzyme [Sinorhizobium mexicanum]QLL61546.1 mandelate racemase/muconate lactonizing protein [Sinorhizobium mexicanum]